MSFVRTQQDFAEAMSKNEWKDQERFRYWYLRLMFELMSNLDSVAVCQREMLRLIGTEQGREELIRGLTNALARCGWTISEEKFIAMLEEQGKIQSANVQKQSKKK